MKDISVEHIANKLNVSRTTVTKAIRHCSGVDSDTRQRILDEIRSANYRPESKCAIYAILPDVPQQFWRPLRKGIHAGEQPDIAPVKYNIYTSPKDETIVLHYLEEAEQLNARVVIISSYITPKIHQKLESMTDGRLVILLSEHYELKNSFYVGGDAYSDGYVMGKQYLSLYADRKLVLMSIPENINMQKRLEGFSRAVEEENPLLISEAFRIEIDNKTLKNKKLLPSKLAPQLQDAAKSGDKLCIYSLSGVQQLSLAVTKARLTDKTVYMCHDHYFAENSDSVKTITCNQDIFNQGVSAVKAANDYIRDGIYPGKKEMLIPSILNVTYA